MSLIFRLLSDCCRSVRSRERARHRRVDVDRLAAWPRTIDRIDRRGPQRVVGAADDQALQREFRGADRRLRLHQRQPPVGRFGLRRHDVDRRQRADLDARLVVLHQLARDVERVLRRFDRLNREDQIPVGVPRVGLRRRHCRLQRDLVVLLADPIRLERRSRRVDLEAAQQRLRDVPVRPDWNCGFRRLIDAGLLSRLLVHDRL